MKKINIIIGTVTISIAALSFTGCESLDDSITQDPYGGGREPIGIKLLAETPIPEKGYPGDTVMFKTRGLMNLYDESTKSFGFKFYMNEVETPVYEATDTTLTVIVPENISTGLTYLVAENQVFYGPTFTVLGNLSVDSDYKLTDVNFGGAIYDCLESRHSGVAHNYYLVGGFGFVDKTQYNGIVFVNEQGTVASPNTTNYNLNYGYASVYGSGTGESYIKSISYFDDKQMLVTGSFSNMYINSSNTTLMPKNQVPVYNVAVLRPNAMVDTVQVKFNELGFNSSESGKYQPLSSYNGGTNAAITESFVTSDQKVILVGNFTQYFRAVYAEWFSENTETATDVTCVVRTGRDGTLDESYRNKAAGYTGANGTINDAYFDENDGVVLVGNFSTFDGVPAPGIVRIDKDGNVDHSFLANIGKGTDLPATKIRYNQKLRKAVLAGSFTSFNGQPRNSLAVIDNNGNLDETFVPREISGGTFDFGTMLNGGKIVASGTFRLYDGVPRLGFVVLEPDGEAIQRFNVPGEFTGELNQVIETETSIGNYGLLLLGDITRFNGKIVNNAVMLEADFNN